MTFQIRPARHDDKTGVASFTQDTFEWGDYVYGSFDEWVDDDDSRLLIAVDDDIPVGLARGIMMSEREAWLHAARVHPDHRREGIGVSINQALCDWAQQQGADVARLAIEDWNEAAQGQVMKSGYRSASQWWFASREVDSQAPNPLGNGGTRVPGPERLVPAHSAEAEPAWMAWSSGRLSRAARGLFPTGWWWRSLTGADLREGAVRRSLWSCPSGWILGEVIDGVFDVDWLEATEDELPRLIRAIVDKAVDLSVPKIQLSIPAVDAARLALDRYGFGIFGLTVYERGL